MTLWISNYLLVKPITTFEGLNPFRTVLDFSLLAISVLLIMAGGNVVNDLYDERTDILNKRDNLSIKLGRKIAWVLYSTLSFSGLLTGFFLCLKISALELWAIHVTAALMLFWYSAYLKGTPLGGNMLVALLCGLIPLLPLIFEKSDYLYFLRPEYFMISFMCLFAILTTLVRELVKDLEDIEGDSLTGKLSIPVVLGEKAAKSLAVIFILCLLIILASMAFVTSDEWASPLYTGLLLFLPFSIILFKLLRSFAPSEYRRVSASLKLLMLSGLGYVVLYHYTCL